MQNKLETISDQDWVTKCSLSGLFSRLKSLGKKDISCNTMTRLSRRRFWTVSSSCLVLEADLFAVIYMKLPSSIQSLEYKSWRHSLSLDLYSFLSRRMSRKRPLPLNPLSFTRIYNSHFRKGVKKVLNYMLWLKIIFTEYNSFWFPSDFLRPWIEQENCFDSLD